MPDQKPRPPLDETLAHIDAVLAEPAPPPLLLGRGQHDDRVDQVLATADTARDEEPVWAAYLFGRAIGWFRR